jgi:predicted extracellular nuclease
LAPRPRQESRFFVLRLFLALLISAPVTALLPSPAAGAQHDSPPQDSPGKPGGEPQTSASNILRIGTFNIRMFPCNNDCGCIKESGFTECKGRNTRRTNRRALASEIRRLHPTVLAVNEILKPKRFARFSAEHMGPTWRFIFTEEGGPQKTGFLYDSSVVDLVSRSSVRDMITKIDPSRFPEICVKRLRKQRPAFVCRFRMKQTGFDFFAIVVHMKAGPCGSLRKAQWNLMRHIVDRLAAKDEDIFIMGDLNDYSPHCEDTAEFRAATGFRLLTGKIPCTHLHRGKGNRLDHILVSPAALGVLSGGRVRVGGPCAHYCTYGRSWKRYLSNVSDHCPVIAEFRVRSR